MEFSKLQQTCILLLITKIDMDDSEPFINLLNPILSHTNTKISTLINLVQDVAYGKTSALTSLENFFNLIDSEPFESVLMLEDKTLSQKQKTLLQILVSQLCEIEKPSLRSLTKLEAALFSILHHIASFNLNCLTDDIYQYMVHALQGDENAQKKILGLRVDALLIGDFDQTMCGFLNVLSKVIVEYENVFYRGVGCFKEAKEEEVKEEYDIETITTKYKEAFNLAANSFEIGHPQAPGLITLIGDSLYMFANMKFAQAKMQQDSDQASILFDEIKELAILLVEFQHEQAEKFFASVSYIVDAFQVEQANKNFKLALQTYEDVKRKSSYYGATFDKARQLAATAKKQGLSEASVLLNEMFNGFLNYRYRMISKQIKGWLQNNHHSEQERELILNNLNKLKKEISPTSGTLKVNSEIKELVKACFKILRAQEHIVNKDPEAALDVIKNIKEPNTATIEALVQELNYDLQAQQSKPKPKKKLKILIEEDDEPVSPKKKKLEKNLSISPETSPPQKLRNKQAEIFIKTETQEIYPSPQTSSRASKDLTNYSTSKIATPHTPNLIKEEVKKEDNFQSSSDETNQTTSIVQLSKGLSSHSTESQPLLPQVGPEKLHKFQDYFGKVLIAVGVVLMVGGIIGISVASGGTALLLFLGIIATGFFTSMLGLTVSKPTLTNCRKNQVTEDDSMKPQLSVQHDFKPEITHYKNPLNLFTRKKVQTQENKELSSASHNSLLM